MGSLRAVAFLVYYEYFWRNPNAATLRGASVMQRQEGAASARSPAEDRNGLGLLNFQAQQQEPLHELGMRTRP